MCSGPNLKRPNRANYLLEDFLLHDVMHYSLRQGLRSFYMVLLSALMRQAEKPLKVIATTMPRGLRNYAIDDKSDHLLCRINKAFCSAVILPLPKRLTSRKE